MHFITRRIREKVIKALFASNISINVTEEEIEGIYEYPIRTLDILNEEELKRLAQIKKIFYNLHIYIEEVYGKVELKNTWKYVNEPTGKPFFHLYIDCQRGNMPFLGDKYPLEVEIRGQAEKERFHLVFHKNKHLDFPLFEEKLLTEFSYLQDANLLHEIKKNSGLAPFQNIDIADTKNKIDISIKTINSLQRKIKSEERDYSSAHIEHLEDTKEELKILLVDYYSAGLNPNLRLQEKLLDTLGFKQCGACGERYITSGDFDRF